MSDIPQFIKNVQSIEVRPSEIFDLVGEMAALHDEGGNPDWYTAAAITAGNFHSNPDKVISIMERMGCLIALMKDPRMRGWTIARIEEGCVFTHQSVFAATAKCTLQINEERIFFDPEEFFRIALIERDAEGQA
jgi:hypothetical protein